MIQAPESSGIYGVRLNGVVRERRNGIFRGVRHDGGSFVVDSTDEVGISLLLNSPRGSCRLDRRTYDGGGTGMVSLMMPGHPFGVELLDPTVAIQTRLSVSMVRNSWLSDHDGIGRIEDISPDPGSRQDAFARLLCLGARIGGGSQEEITLEIAYHLLNLADPGGCARRERLLKRGGLAPSRLRRAMEMIEERLADQITLADVASEVGMSPFHFARSFRRETGQSCLGYIQGRRVAHVLRALDSKLTSLEQIALAAGFSHASHLNRHLIARFGLPGSRIRELMSI